MQQSKKLPFRYDINGLRAFAVLSVLFYHFTPAILPGGFTGVDVFFVISGFLMTGIIYEGIASDTFSIKKFYIARVRRIVPALLVVLCTLFVFGFFYLPPSYNKELCNQIVSSIGFVSNILFWKQSGYFSTDAQQKWLLHTWSLAVEFQFYIIYPICCVVLKKLLGREWLRRGIALAAVVGLIFSILFSVTSQVASFYLFPSRAWEMLFGGVVYLYPLRLGDRQKIYLELIGLAMVATSWFFYSGTMIWPYYYALLPVLGACLILWSCRNTSVVTGNVICQQIGSASYSIYLWHWPIFVFLNFFNLKNESTLLQGIFFSIILGFISYYAVERGARRASSSAKFVPAVVATCLVLGCGSYLIGRSVFVSPIQYDSRYAYSPKEYHEAFYGGKGILSNRVIEFGGTEQKFILVGDSFARQYGRVLSNRSKELNFSATALFDDGCMILPELTRFIKGIEDKSCSAEYSKLKTVLTKYPDLPVLLAYSWDSYEQKLGAKAGDLLTFSSTEEYYSTISQQLRKLMADGGRHRKYYLIARPQRTSFNAIECLSKADLLFGQYCPDEMKQAEISVNRYLKNFASKNQNVFWIDPNQVLCRDGMCAIVTNDGYPVRSDKGHLSVFGAEPVIDLILSEVLAGKLALNQ